MNKLANARSDETFVKNGNPISRRGCGLSSNSFLGEFYSQEQKRFFFEGKAISPAAIFCIFARFY